MVISVWVADVEPPGSPRQFEVTRVGQILNA